MLRKEYRWTNFIKFCVLFMSLFWLEKLKCEYGLDGGRGALCRFCLVFFCSFILSSSSFNWLVKWSFSISLNSHWNALSYFHEFFYWNKISIRKLWSWNRIGLKFCWCKTKRWFLRNLNWMEFNFDNYLIFMHFIALKLKFLLQLKINDWVRPVGLNLLNIAGKTTASLSDFMQK